MLTHPGHPTSPEFEAKMNFWLLASGLELIPESSIWFWNNRLERIGLFAALRWHQVAPRWWFGLCWQVELECQKEPSRTTRGKESTKKCPKRVLTGKTPWDHRAHLFCTFQLWSPKPFENCKGGASTRAETFSSFRTSATGFPSVAPCVIMNTFLIPEYCLFSA